MAKFKIGATDGGDAGLDLSWENKMNSVDGAICEKTGTYCNLGACPYEDLKEFAAVRHGRWEAEDNVFDDSTWICSACHEPWVLIDGTPQDNNMNFCPNCGADMREENHE